MRQYVLSVYRQNSWPTILTTSRQKTKATHRNECRCLTNMVLFKFRAKRYKHALIFTVMDFPRGSVLGDDKSRENPLSFEIKPDSFIRG